MNDNEFGRKVKEIYDKVNLTDSEETNLKRDNANINGDTPMGAMLQQGANTAKEYYLDKMIDPLHARLHREGWIHIHDLDFYGWTTTCTQIELRKLFKGGFDTGHGHLREPKSIGSYAALAAIAIQSNQNDQHGGQSIADFDYAMGDGVRLTYKRYYEEGKKLVDSLEPEMSDDRKFKWVSEYAKKKTTRDTYQAMEGLIHNLNTMHSRAGAQVPFSSINYGMDTSWGGKLAVEQLLLATEAGLGNGETPIFPIQIFRVKEGVNFNYGDPNYDLFKLAIRVSARRLFPNFSFIDAPSNLQYYKPGHPETEISYMGAVTGEDIITIKVDGRILTLPFKDAYECFHEWMRPVYILDRGSFVRIKAWQCYPDGGDWYEIKFSNGRYLKLTSDHPLPTQRGRVLCENLEIGDSVPIATYNNVFEGGYPSIDAWAMGVLLCDGNINATVSVGTDERDIGEKLIELFGGSITEQHRGYKGNYLDVYLPHGDDKKISSSPMLTYFGSNLKRNRLLPTDFLCWHEDDRLKLLAGIIDADGYIDNKKHGCVAVCGSVNKALAIEEMILAESLGFVTKLSKTTYGRGEGHFRYVVSFKVTRDIPLVSEKKRIRLSIQSSNVIGERFAVVKEITKLGYTNEMRYDVTTESDRFDVSGLNSHNCRTRVMGNIYDPTRQISFGRGNLSFTSINLPRLAIESKGDQEVFFDSLNQLLEIVADQLYSRYLVQKKRKIRNFPFLMGQNVWIDSDGKDPDDEVGDILNHGTLSIGFIGLAETLVALIGKHHGESIIAQDLGLKIIRTMRSFCDDKSVEWNMNVTLLATPAESLSGRFVKMDKERYGVIKGVTDRDYYTNSFHVPVYYHLSAAEKIRIEAPYHALTNAGHITYIELDGDTSKNLGAFERVIRYMKEWGIGYGAINHPVDRDPVCGYNGIIGDVCPKCGRTEGNIPFERIRRITGYLTGSTRAWNDAKRAEEKDRVKHGV